MFIDSAKSWNKFFDFIQYVFGKDKLMLRPPKLNLTYQGFSILP
jgi:hypothetical protein